MNSVFSPKHCMKPFWILVKPILLCPCSSVNVTQYIPSFIHLLDSRKYCILVHQFLPLLLFFARHITQHEPYGAEFTTFFPSSSKCTRPLIKCTSAISWMYLCHHFVSVFENIKAIPVTLCFLCCSYAYLIHLSITFFPYGGFIKNDLFHCLLRESLEKKRAHFLLRRVAQTSRLGRTLYFLQASSKSSWGVSQLGFLFTMLCCNIVKRIITPVFL